MNDRRILVAGNWKMNTTIPEGLALAEAISEIAPPDDVDVIVLPPHTHLWSVYGLLSDTGIAVGAQDVFWEDRGAYTGEVSPTMLAGWCELALVGHSERRHILGESDATVARKVMAALRHDLGVMLAVGETEAERDGGATMDVVTRQLSTALADLGASHRADLVIAYEPVWAIGTGRTATVDQAQEVCGAIRRWLTHSWDGESAAATRILYGGSVTPDNAADLFAAPDIDGALVGGASLRAEGFGTIVAAAAAQATS